MLYIFRTDERNFIKKYINNLECKKHVLTKCQTNRSNLKFTIEEFIMHNLTFKLIEQVIYFLFDEC